MCWPIPGQTRFSFIPRGLAQLPLILKKGDREEWDCRFPSPGAPLHCPQGGLVPVAWTGGKTRQKSELTLLGKCPSGSGPWLCCLCLAFLVSNRGSNRKSPESSRKDCQRELFFSHGETEAWRGGGLAQSHHAAHFCLHVLMWPGWGGTQDPLVCLHGISISQPLPHW